MAEHSCTRLALKTGRMCLYICFIIITKLYVVFAPACVTICAYYNIPGFAFIERSLAQVKLLMLIL